MLYVSFVKNYFIANFKIEKPDATTEQAAGIAVILLAFYMFGFICCRAGSTTDVHKTGAIFTPEYRVIEATSPLRNFTVPRLEY